MYGEERKDDLKDYNVLNLIGLCGKYSFQKALPTIKEIIHKKYIPVYQRKEALEVIYKLGENEAYFSKIYDNFKSREDEEKGIADKADIILIENFENKEAVYRAIKKIKSMKISKSERNSEGNISKLIPRNDILYQILNALSIVSNPNFIDDYIKLLDHYFRLQIEQSTDPDDMTMRAIKNAIVKYFDNLKKYNAHSFLQRLENHINKNYSDRIEVSWFKYDFRLLKASYLNYLGKDRCIKDCIGIYNQLMDRKYLLISTPLDLLEMVKKIINEDIRKWVEEERAYAFIKEAVNNQESLIQKTLVTQLENCFLRRGFRNSDIMVHREVQSYDDKRPDFLITYGFIPPIVIEVKRLDNPDITNKKKRAQYKKKLEHYITANNASHAIYLIFKIESKKSKIEDYYAIQKQYDKSENIRIEFLDCIQSLCASPSNKGPKKVC